MIARDEGGIITGSRLLPNERGSKWSRGNRAGAGGVACIPACMEFRSVESSSPLKALHNAGGTVSCRMRTSCDVAEVRTSRSSA
jgi:hypothetical protein